MDKVASRTSTDPEKNVDASSLGSDKPVVNSELEAKVWRKLDVWILPVVTMFYLLSFLDRTNIGNAKVAGLLTELKMTPKQYSIALTVTYVPYIAAELPSNLLLKIVGPNLMLPAMITLWGVVTTCQGTVKTYGGLLACRFFLGLLEGGVFPGLVLYLSFFYPRLRLQTRIAAFFSAASISGAFGGIMAYGIINLNKKDGHSGWQWIFIIEGAITVLFGLVTGNSFSWGEVGKAFTSIHVILVGVIFFFSVSFTPSIVVSLGYTAAKAQLMSVPPFSVAFVLTMITAVTVFASVLCTIGFAMFLGSKNHHVQYGSLFLSIPGTYLMAPAISTWNANNAAPHVRRATAIAIGFIMTNSGGILATWLLGSLSPAPLYTKATKILLIFSVLMGFFAVLNIVHLTRENKKKEEVRGRATRSEEEEGLGDQSAV
ncbi:major facilitator superfamily domain-containing protein, partial [Mycena galericulata]